MKKYKVSDWFWFFAPRFMCLALVLGLLVRIALVFHPVTVVDWGIWDWVKIVVLGILNDVAFSIIALVPAFIVYTFLTDDKYKKPWGWAFYGLFTLLTAYILFFNDITDEYGGPMPRIVNGILAFLWVCFTIKLLVPGIRKGWRRVAIYIVMLLYAIAAITIAISEVVFWSEFGVRFNFIAVDYLVYTNEVVGNIIESYPMVPMVLGMLIVSGAVVWLMTRDKDIRDSGNPSWRNWAVTLVLLAAGCAAAGGWLHLGYRNFGGKNTFATQIQENGCWDFLEAFSSSELDYEQFYPMIDSADATALKDRLCGMEDGVRKIRHEQAPLRKNIVLITIESLSADFLTRYGCEDGITPCLDTLMEKSLVFDNLFATGNRTVRGLEAVTLSLPPSSGESLVKRSGIEDFFSTGKVLRDNGYTTSFLYGGDSYFDNMGAFFSSCGYDIIDKGDYDPDAIAFSNIWGTSDEDSYREALSRFDAFHAEGKPFFTHIMTISNHRPYTYPEGRITYEGNPMSRRAAVKYTDWAIGDFIAKASQKPWFSETVFVILADHCASSAGKTTLPLEGYHIPALIYSPGFIQPGYVDKVCSQIDLMPTLFNLLRFSYDSKFYGCDILSPDFKERAFMATYQDLGYYSGNVLTVLSPVRKVRQSLVEKDGRSYKETLLEKTEETALKEAQAYYQSANLQYN